MFLVYIYVYIYIYLLVNINNKHPKHTFLHVPLRLVDLSPSWGFELILTGMAGNHGTLTPKQAPKQPKQIKIDSTKSHWSSSITIKNHRFRSSLCHDVYIFAGSYTLIILSMGKPRHDSTCTYSIANKSQEMLELPWRPLSNPTTDATK